VVECAAGGRAVQVRFLVPRLIATLVTRINTMGFQQIAGFAGLLSIATPAIVFLKFFSKDLRKNPIELPALSWIALKDNRKLFSLKLFLILNGIWSFILLSGVNNTIEDNFKSLVKILPYLILALFVISSFNLSRRYFRQHVITATILGVILWISKIFYGQLFFRTNPTLAYISYLTALLDFILVIYPALKKGGRLKALDQVKFSILLSFWVFFLSVYLLI
jgi:hypothetical protein